MLTPEELQKLRDALAAGRVRTGRLGAACGWNPSVARAKLIRLERAGYVARHEAENEFEDLLWSDEGLESYEEGAEAPRRAREGARPEASSGGGFAAAGPSDARGEAAGPVNPYAPPREEALPTSTDASEGNFWLGFLAGALGGCIVFIIVLTRAKPATKRGLYWGIGAQFAVYAILRAVE